MDSDSVKELYTGNLIATPGNGMRVSYKADVEASSPAEARLLVKAAWERQTQLTNPRILEIRLWKNGEPVD
jgi:hypothetical protein